MWPTDKASIDRAFDRLLQAFHEARIDKENTANQIPSVLGGTIAYWRTRESRIEVVFASKNLLWGGIECVIDMRGFAESTLILFPDESEAVQSIVEVLNYLRQSASLILVETSQGLQQRASNTLRRKQTGKNKRALTNLHTALLRPQAEAIEQRRKEIAAQLRDETERRGGSEARHDWTDEDRGCLLAQYERLKPIWLEAKKIAKAAQKSRERTRKEGWRDEVLRAYPFLPTTLLERLATPRADDAKPSHLALIHASQACGITYEYSARQLNAELRAWKLKISN